MGKERHKWTDRDRVLVMFGGLGLSTLLGVCAGYVATSSGGEHKSSAPHAATFASANRAGAFAALLTDKVDKRFTGKSPLGLDTYGLRMQQAHGLNSAQSSELHANIQANLGADAGVKQRAAADCGAVAVNKSIQDADPGRWNTLLHQWRAGQFEQAAGTCLADEWHFFVAHPDDPVDVPVGLK